MSDASSSQLPDSNSALHKIIGIIDIDSFECQIYKRLYPEIAFFGKAWVVADKTGRIVSATHEARALGISRQIRLYEAKRLAKQHKIGLQIFEKPNDREKPSTKEVRYASWEIVDCLKDYVNNHSFGTTLEFASSDEFYLDLTREVDIRMKRGEFFKVIESRTFLETSQQTINGEALRDIISSKEYSEQEKKLIYGGLIMQDVNNLVFRKTKLVASVGVSSNKLLAKLAVNVNKPNGITILLENALSRLGHDIQIEKIPGFGSSFGAFLKEVFSISTMKELENIDLEQLVEVFDEDKGMEIFMKCRGMSDEPVKDKLMTDEVSCGKAFYGQIKSDETLHYHMYLLIEEWFERMEEELQRHARQPTIIRFAVIYTSTEKGPEEQKLSWAHSAEHDLTKSCSKHCEDALRTFFDETKIEFEKGKVRINRVEVRAKAFIFK